MKLDDWNLGEVSGIPSVEVKFVDIRKNTRDIGPEAFRAILEQFAAECAAGEEPRVRGKAFCKRVKAAVDEKKAVAK